MDKNGIIVYTSCGQGHKKAAYALANHFRFPCIDFLDFSPPGAKIIYSWGYSFVVRYFPSLWVSLFEITKLRIIKYVINYIHVFAFSAFLNFLAQKKPRYVILTHFFPIRLVAVLKRRLFLKLIVVVTDVGVHPLWLDKEVDYYLVALCATKDELIAKGISADKIRVTGLPLREGFRKKLNAGEVRKKLALDAKPVILILSSTQGNIRFLKEIVDELSDDFILLIIYGENKRVETFLK